MFAELAMKIGEDMMPPISTETSEEADITSSNPRGYHV
jgi:hypothetical protein